MRYYLLLIALLVGLTALYYITLIIHIFTGVFGDNVNTNKLFIPFYGWIKGSKTSTQTKEQETKQSKKKTTSKK
jgi:hypothetical protein